MYFYFHRVPPLSSWLLVPSSLQSLIVHRITWHAKPPRDTILAIVNHNVASLRRVRLKDDIHGQEVWPSRIMAAVAACPRIESINLSW